VKKRPIDVNVIFNKPKAGKTLPASDRVTHLGLKSNHILNDLKLLAMLFP
jgi:hypothetical protein